MPTAVTDRSFVLLADFLSQYARVHREAILLQPGYAGTSGRIVHTCLMGIGGHSTITCGAGVYQRSGNAR